MLAYRINTSSTNSTYKSLYYVQTADIDLSAHYWDAIGTYTSSSNYLAFSGHYDGGEYTISGLYTKAGSSSAYSYQGLFGYVEGESSSNKATIKNIGIIDSNIQGYRYVGGVVGYAYYYTITNCYNTGDVTGNSSYVGGVVGYAEPSTITNCYNTGTVTGSGDSVGGVVGRVYDGVIITNCYNTGNITGSDGRVGGVVGYADSSATITNSYNTGSVDGSHYVGGVVGDAGSSTITNCYNTGSVTMSSSRAAPSPSASDCFGGVVGNAGSSTITNCYNTGVVTGYRNVGGVVGRANSYSTITNCYYGGNCTLSYGIGSLTSNEGASKDENLITNAKSLSWYQDSSKWNSSSEYRWDFDNVWTIVPRLNDGFPILQYAVDDIMRESGIVSEIYNDAEGKMDEANVSDLFGYLLGEENVDVTSAETLAKLTNLANGTMSSADMREKNDNTDISVRFGGLDWWATYLSKDTGGNVILTLWLDESQQDAFAGRTSTEGQLYGFINNSLYSDWSADWSSGSTSLDNPSNMYGSSYIRCVTLNAGGTYSTSDSGGTSSATQNSNSVFARFTMEEVEGSLTQYITTPSKMSWQLDQSAVREGMSPSYNLTNDSIDVPTSGSYNYNYHSMTNYDEWATDYIWLPSITETGDYSSSSDNGLWETSTEQRQNFSSSESNNGTVGSSNVNELGSYNHSWLRSGYSNRAYDAYRLYPSGDGYSDYFKHNVSYSNAVRPALHLNLSKVIEEIKPLQIVFDNGGGSGMEGIYISGEGFFADEALKEPITKVEVPTKAGYVFEGYYTSADGGVQMIEADGTILGSALDYQNITTLFAVWSEGNLAKYDSVGGYWYVENGKMPQSRVTDEATIEALNTSTLSGDVYEFAGMRFGSVKLSGSENEYFKFDDKWYKVEPIRWRLVYSSAQTSGYGTTEATMAILAEIVYVDAYSDAKLMGGAGYSAESVAPFMTNHINEDKFVTETRTVDLFSETLGSTTTTVSGDVFVASKEEINLFKTTANGTGETVNVGFSDLVSDYLASLGKGEYYFTRSLGNQLNNFHCLSPVGASTQIKAQQAYGIMFSTKVKGYGCQ